MTCTATKKPIRVQRSRARGWRLPENTVCVDRSTSWGNPFKVGALVDFRVLDAPAAVALYRKAIAEGDPALRFRSTDLWKLKGKNLACFCGLDQVCHADVLIELANPDHRTEPQ